VAQRPDADCGRHFFRGSVHQEVCQEDQVKGSCQLSAVS
jgi:hypothetical protein